MISYKQKFLKDELENLTNDGFLSESQKEKIFAHYGFAKSPQKATSSLLFVLSAVLFALSLLTLIGYNWEQIPAFIRTALLLGALLATQIALYFAQNKIYSISLGIFSNFVLLANLALLSQIYHLGDDSAMAFLGVAFVSLLMSFALKSGAIFYQSYIFAAIAFGINATDDILTHSFGIFIIFGFALQIFNGSKILAFFNFFTLLFYLDFGLFGFDLPLNLFILFCVSFSLVFLAFNAMDYKIYALFVLVCALLWRVNVFASAQDYMAFRFVSFWQILIMVAFLLPTLLNFAFKRYFLGILGTLFWLESFRIVTIFVTDSVDFASYIFFAQVFYSFLSLIFGIYLIKNDYKILGILTIFALIIIRYINLLGDYIGASIIFAIFGAVVLFVARKKQKAVQK
ncbi:DUF2157 domain-containing protein [Helicobacter sp. 23-1045]